MAKKTVVTKEEFSPDEEAEGADEAEDGALTTPLFDDIDRTGKQIEKIFVRRIEPASGYMGTLAPDITEQEIFTRWGGGEYLLQAKNAASRIVKARTVKIAGDPQFTSDAEEKRWRRLNGLEAKTSSTNSESKVTDILLLIEEKEEKRRAEQFEREERMRKEQFEKEERERRLRDDREVVMQRERDAREDRLRKDTEEREDRRRREAQEDAQHRAQLHREDMERIAAQNQVQLQQAQTFFSQLAATMKHDEPRTDPVQTLLAGMQVAREMVSPAAAGEGDFLTTLISKLPETLSEIRKTGSAAYAELSGRQAGRPSGVGAEEDFLTLTGPTATRAKAVLAKLAKEGKNPEVVINQLLMMAAGARPAIQPVAPKGKKGGKNAAPTKINDVASLADRARGGGKPVAPRRGRPHGSRNKARGHKNPPFQNPHGGEGSAPPDVEAGPAKLDLPVLGKTTDSDGAEAVQPPAA